MHGRIINEHISWFTVLSCNSVRPQHINTILVDEMVILSHLGKKVQGYIDSSFTDHDVNELFFLKHLKVCFTVVILIIKSLL